MSTGTSTTHTRHPTNKLRSHLLALLPLTKHALFHAKLTIHDVAAVPYVEGEFAAKWRFKNAQAMGGGDWTGRPGLRKMGSRGSLRVIDGNGNGEGTNRSAKGKEREVQRDEDDVDDEEEERERGGRTTPMPGDSESGHGQHYGQFLTAHGPPPHSSSGPSRPPITAQNSYASTNQAPPPSPGAFNFVSTPKGQTHFVPLNAHTVTWSLDVDAAVQMSISRSSASEPATPDSISHSHSNSNANSLPLLQPSELKVTVLKYIDPKETDELAKHNAVLGVVMLNLAEYVGQGIVTRRYLLRESKTNATLKLTIELTQISGETRYKAPPLQKGQILATVAGLISEDHLRSHARSPFHPNQSSGSSSSSIYLPHRPSYSRAVPSGVHTHPPHMAAPIQTTESIIEALFNPFPTQSTAVSPFTYYRPSSAAGATTTTRDGGSISEASGENENGDGDGDGKGEKGGVEKGRERWWRKKEKEKGGGGGGPTGKIRGEVAMTMEAGRRSPWRWKRGSSESDELAV